MAIMRIIYDLGELPPGLLRIYGSGKYASHLSRWINQYRPDIQIDGYIDSFRSGTFLGARLLSLAEARQKAEAEQKLNDSPIVVASNFWKEIIPSMEGVCGKAYVFHPGINPGHMFLPQEYPSIETRAAAIAARLPTKDAAAYMGLIQARRCDAERLRAMPATNLSFEHCHTVSRYPRNGEQYMDYIAWEHVSCLIEGGANNGATTLPLAGKLHENALLHAFEPEAKAFSVACRACAGDGRITMHGKALADYCGTASLYGRGQGSCLTQGVSDGKNDQNIAVTTVDEFAAEHALKIKAIKLDVEGSELAALRGAANTLHNHRPQLAISIYHTQSDMLDIPEYLMESLDGYRFRLGHYSNSLMETVLYAIPEELSERIKPA